MKTKLILISLLLLSCASVHGSSKPNLISNPSFTEKTKDWDALWVRENGKGKAEISETDFHSAPFALRIEYTGSRDWSFSPQNRIRVIPGEIYEYAGWVRADKVAELAELNVVTYDSGDKVIDWAYSETKTSGTHPYKKVAKRFIVPDSCSSIMLRIVGSGKGVSYWDDLELRKLSDAPLVKIKNEKPVMIEGGFVVIEFQPDRNRFDITDKKTPAHYTISTTETNAKMLDFKKVNDQSILFHLFNPDGEPLDAGCSIGDRGRILFSINGKGSMTDDFAFPGRLESEKSESWVVPLNEGLLIPSDDTYFSTWPLALYSGHGLCMPFIGLTDMKSGIVVIAETPFDAIASYYQPANNETSSWLISWQPSFGKWSYERKLSISIVRGTGYVGIAKEYRDYAKTKGLVVTLSQKEKLVPETKKLIGAVDLWFWADAPNWVTNEAASRKFAMQLNDKGITNVLWSSADSKTNIEYFNSLGFLAGRYDCYQDVYSPDTPLDWVNKNGWPDDLVLLPTLAWMPGWVSRENGKEYTGGVICSERSLAWMKKTIPDDLAGHPYKARFIDTTTASPLRECYNPRHPLTRADDMKYKSKMLDYVSNTLELVTGSETGMDWAVPYLHYFEGMMSLGPYRVTDAGYDLIKNVKPDDSFMRFQVGTFYRIPLFELVYHDCVVSYWYWGDSSNRIPDVWKERDLFNVLYGTPPLWIVDPHIWAAHADRFIESYKDARSTATRSGGSEMVSHQFVSPDRSVQFSEFANHVKVWVNFSATRYVLKSGDVLQPKSYLISD
jgi:hypothetical protein